MAELHRKTKPGRFNTAPVFLTKTIVQTQNTTVNNLVSLPRTKCYVSKASVTLTTIGSDADGTIVGTLFAVGIDGSTARALASGLDLEIAGVATALVPVAMPITASDVNRVLLQGETLRFAIVSSVTTDTAPVGDVNVEVFVLE
jgi:hypothetical protein